MIRLLRLLFPAGRHARGQAERRLVALVALGVVVWGCLALVVLRGRADPAIEPASPSQVAQVDTPVVPPEFSLVPRPPDVPEDQVVARILLVPAVAFTAAPTWEDVTPGDLQARWQTGAGGPLLVPDATAQGLELRWGPPHSSVERLPDEEAVVARLWQTPDAVAILPFDRLTPAVRSLSLEGRTLLDRTVSNDDWPLAIPLVASDPGATDYARRTTPAWNRTPETLGTVIVTGVTAMARSVYTTMRRHADMAYPARMIADLLAGADLTHVSNEVSFHEGCVPSDFTTAFCADPAAMETLTMLGVDLVELTGNHNNDVGTEAALASLDLYREAGIATFGGGADLRAAAQPALIDVRGTTIAFLGYNQFGPDYAWASEESPGANPWPRDAARLRADIEAARRAGADLVFVHVQHTESYQVLPLSEQRADFRAAIDAGADAVVGTQAHTPQAIEFYRGKPIFYGLGNLIFDQMQSLETRQSLVVRYTVQGGRLLQAELFTTIIEDYAQPRLTTPAERDALLDSIFAETEFTPEAPE